MTTSSTDSNYRWYHVGDLNAFFALMIDNMINLVVFANLLIFVFGFPAQLIYTRMIPGTAIGVAIGDIIYSVLAIRLAKRTGRQDITAMPLGLDTPSTIGVALAVIGPAFVAAKQNLLQTGMVEATAASQAAYTAWGIGMACMIMMGLVKVAFSFIGEWIRQHVPQAGLLGSIGGIGLALLCFFPLIDTFKSPVVGLVCLGLMLATLVAKVDLPGKLPGAAVAVLAGTLIHYFLGSVGLVHGFQWPSIHLQIAPPIPTLEGVFALKAALPYLPIAIPFGLLTIVGGINVTESAHAAGDHYSTRSILLTEAIATFAAGLFGGVVQSTPYIGHPAYKQMGARAGYTFATALAVGLGGTLGLVSFVVAALPQAAVVPLLIFIGLEITVQAFFASPRAHAPAVAFAFTPIVADLVLIRQETLTGNVYGILTEKMSPDALPEAKAAIAAALERIDAPVIVGLGHGFILTAMLWGSILALMIDFRFRQATFFVLLTALFTSFGLIHSFSPAGDLYWPWNPPASQVWHWVAGYGALAIVMIVLSWVGRRAPDPMVH